MTDRIHSLTVVLREDVRDDDIEPLLVAIRLLSPVLAVSTHISGSIGEHVAATRVDAEWRDSLYALMKERRG